MLNSKNILWVTKMVQQKSTIIPEELQQFARLSQQWWQADGPNKFLHEMNPIRLQYIYDQLQNYFHLEGLPLDLSTLRILDVGCGGGIATEPLARLKGQVTGIDATADNIDIAKQHAKEHDLKIDYQCTTLETFAESHKATFDVVLMLELIEHVQHPETLITAAAQCLKPHGLLILSTINRTPQSFLLAKVIAEYVLHVVPRGTHHWQQFFKPSEIVRFLASSQFELMDLTGLSFSPLKGAWTCTKNIGVNYIMTAKK